MQVTGRHLCRLAASAGRRGSPGRWLGVLDVGLGPAAALAPVGGAVGLNLPHVIAGSGQRQHHRTPQAARALDPNSVDAQGGALEQRQQLGDARLGDRERQRDDQDAEDVDDGHGGGVLCGSFPATAWVVFIFDLQVGFGAYSG